MNKEDFDAALATLQAKYDAAERAVVEASRALSDTVDSARDARKALRGHVTYGKHMGWIERAKWVKRAKREEEPAVADAAE